MRKISRFLVIFAVVVFGAAGFMIFISSAASGVNWTQATTASIWTGRYAHAALSFNNDMWVMGGRDTFSAVKNDVWYSPNGTTWWQATSSAAWERRYQFGAVVFNNKMWVMGGENASYALLNDVWYSVDGVTWMRAVANAPWSARKDFSAVVFDNKIWIMGGMNSLGFFNDVWYSSDGFTWTQATAHAAWTDRATFAVAVHNDKMWLSGGWGDALPADTYFDDVWYSSDGITWTQATANATQIIRGSHAMVTYSGKLWILGGSTLGGIKNDVWYSSDGIAWTQSSVSAGWDSRWEHTAIVFNNKIWLMGGTGNSIYYNDVWSSSLLNPIVDLKVNDSNGPVTVPYNSTVTLSWTSINADSCVASGGWSGTKDSNGSGVVSNVLTGSTQFTIVCPNATGVSAVDSVTVNVQSCTESWTCGTWSSCSAFGLQTRTCTDANSCGTTATIPAVSQSCSCTESWTCGDWSSCSAFGLQTRTCTDFNNCGTTASKPAVSQSCSCVENWSCGAWSSCSAFGLQTRTCSDAGSCGTVVDKPAASQSCGTTCNESWSCGAWSACSAGNQTRTCSDANTCGTTVIKPVISQSCTAAVTNPATMDISCPSLQAGDMIKVVGKPAIYALNNDLKVLYFPSGDEFKSWRENYGGYISITQECYDSLPVPTTYPAAVNFRPGSYVVKKASADQLYVVEPNNTLAKITPAAAETLYGADYKVMSVADVFWPHYINRGTDVAAAVPHPGMLVKSGLTTYYVDFGNKMREVDSAGMINNEFQTKFVRPVVSSLISTLSAGEKISNAVPSIVDKVQSGN